MDILESFILSDLGQYRNKFGRDVFYLPEDKDINLFTEVFDFILKRCDHWKDETVKYPQRTIITDKEKDKERKKAYYEANKEELLEKQRQFVEENKEVLDDIMPEIRKQYYEKNFEAISEKRKLYYQKNKKEIINNSIETYYDNREQILENRKEFYENNKEHILQERSEYYKKNYNTKIKAQRSVKETCECGLTVTHYVMKKHKLSQRHELRMQKLQSELQLNTEI